MTFEDLQVWKRSSRLCVDIYRAFRESRDYGFKDQITRSALSVASNIAEGYDRDTDKDRVKFLSYAKGSCAELRTQVYIGLEIGYIPPAEGKRWIDETRELSKMLHALMRTMRPA